VAAKAVIDLIANTKQFRSRMDGVSRRLKGLAGSMEAVSRAARRMLVVGGAAATGATIAFGSFEQKMARVKALTGATGDQFKELNQTARDLGKATVFSANEAAEAMASFALQGFQTNQIIAAMPATLNLAAAGQLAMGQAAEITAGIMRGMKLTTEDLVRVVDVIAKAATSSATDVPMLGEAMKALGPIAKTAGLSLEESVAVIRAMSDVMIQGQMAGTSFRNILIRLQSGSGESAKAMKALGVSIKDDTGAMKPFADIVDEIRVALSQYDQVTQNAIVAQIAGTRAVAGFSEIMALGGDTIRRYTKELADSGGTADRIAKIQINTLFGSFKLLTSAATEMAITLGSQFKPAIEGTANFLRSLIDGFNELNASTKTTIAILGGVGAAFVGLTAIAPFVLKFLAGTVLAVKALIPVLVALKLELAILLTNPIVAVLAGVAAALIVAGKAWRDYKRNVFEARQEMDATMAALGSGITGFKDLAKARNELADAETLDEKIAATENLIAVEKELINQIRQEAEQRGSAASDEQRADIMAQAERNIARVNRQISQQTKSLTALGDEKKRLAAIEEQQAQRQRENAEQQAALMERTRKANAKAATQIQDLTNAIAVAKGETTEEALELVDLFKLGATVEKIVELLDLQKQLKDVESKNERLENLKAEADVLRDSVKTEKERKAEALARIDLLENEKLITAEVAAKARDALNAEKERASIVGKIEGLRALYTRISEAAGGRKSTGAVSSPQQQSTANATKKTADATQQTTKNTGTMSSVLQRILDMLVEVRDGLPLAGAFS